MTGAARTHGPPYPWSRNNQFKNQQSERTWALPDEDLLDPACNPWLNGRKLWLQIVGTVAADRGKLWLQIVVRGFWHPTGHPGTRGRPGGVQSRLPGPPAPRAQ